MTKPDDCHIATAEAAAARSPCAKSKRGVALFDPETGAHRGEGWNGPPGGAPCPGRAICGDRCGKLCVHAEMRALRSVPAYRALGHPSTGLHLLHIKLGPDGHVTPGGPPSCWQCSREILDVGFVAGVWLYETMPEEWCPHFDEPRVDCVYCQGELCCQCDTAGPRVRCDHDVLDRHRGMPIVDARWRFYAAADFHISTLRVCGIQP